MLRQHWNDDRWVFRALAFVDGYGVSRHGSPTRGGSFQPRGVKLTSFAAPEWMQATMNKLPMTAGGHSALQDELTNRIRIERPRLIQRIQEAIADDSNLAENSEYQAAKTEQEINEARIAELEDKLARAEIIDVCELSGDTIKFGATVTVIEEGPKEGMADCW
jgi:hypothetical protein